MIAGGIHAPHEIIETEGEPRDGYPVAHVEGCRHPPELVQSQPAVVGVVEKIDGIVPVDEAVLEHTEERGEGERYDEEAQRRPQGVRAGPAARSPILRDQGVRMGTRSTKTRWGMAEFETRTSLRGMKPGAVISIV